MQHKFYSHYICIAYVQSDKLQTGHTVLQQISFKYLCSWDRQLNTWLWLQSIYYFYFYAEEYRRCR